MILPSGNTLPDICIPYLRISRLSAGYQRYNIGYHEKIDQISIIGQI